MVEIKDDGQGFDPLTRAKTGNGLTNMQNRASELNGYVTIESVVGEGTTLTAVFPLASLNNVGW